MDRSFAKIAAATVLGLSLTACGGGGEPGNFSAGIETFLVTPAGQAAVAAGNRVTIKAVAETFGPTITSIVWRAQPLANAKGEVFIDDESCSAANKRDRAVPNRADMISYWDCTTSAFASEEASGPFMVQATVNTSNGSQQTESFTLNVN